ncbi:MAG TPA: BTAD domain-containing putative transcriptional regulator [Streptosporangiaceae bacterium]|nr:BTAD domain-containing putative transcriptional regulator [Streptosporangiaceae bacterium]
MESRPHGLLVSLLGPVEVSVSGQPVHVSQPRQRALLALLALSANRVVTAEVLIDGLWAEQQSRPRERNLHAHVSQLRKLLRELEPDAASPRVTTRMPGYQLTLHATELDLTQFAALVARGRQAARGGQPALAEEAFGHALALWRGHALADVVALSGRLADQAAYLEEQRLAVQEDRAEARLAGGRHVELTAELAALVDQHPLRERLRGQLMRALYQSGRQAEALARYQEGRTVLRTELGVNPGQELQDLHRRILRADPALAPPTMSPALAHTPLAPPRRDAAPDATAAVLTDIHDQPAGTDRPTLPLVPRQLPVGVRHFAGRECELAQLNGLLKRAAARDAVVIAAIGGSGGVGKTTLAVHWAHTVADQFPDGQLHVNLRGYDPGGTPVSPAEAVREFLAALGVPATQLPNAPEAQVTLYQSLLAGRRILILLDNARDAAQVRPLLPTAPGCLAIITSRSALPGLAPAHEIIPVPLGVASHAEAEAMLAARLGQERVAAEPEAVAGIIELCARLPLALAITAARAATNQSIPLAALGAEMTSEQDRLDALDLGDPVTSLRAVFSWSTGQLSEPAARMFRLLALHPGPDATGPASASLTGITRADAQRLLTELVNAGLLAEHSPGRFAFHDLLRVFAAEQAAVAETAASRRAATARCLDHYLYSARHAGAQIFGPGLPLPELPPLPDKQVVPEYPQASREAVPWFEAEHQVLIAAATFADSIGLDAHAWQIPCTMTQYFRAVARARDWEMLNRIALAAAGRLGDEDALGRVRFSIGTYQRISGAFDEAITEFDQSMACFRATGDELSQAAVHMGISMAHVSRRPTLPEGQVDADARAALAHARAALAIYRRTGEITGQERALKDLSEHYLALGELLTAQECCREAIRLSIETGHRAGEAEARATMGRISYGLERYDKAIEYYLQFLGIWSEAGIPIRPANILEDLGDAYLAAGNIGAARAVWREVIDIGQQLRQASEEPSWRIERVRAKLEELAKARPGRPPRTAPMKLGASKPAKRPSRHRR